MQCEHSTRTWTPTPDFWVWDCPVCGLVDGFTGEKKMTFYGHAWVDGVHADARIDETGAVLSASGPARLRSQAIEAAERDRSYNLARRRDTEHEKLRYSFLCTWERGGPVIYIDELPGQSCRHECHTFSDSEIAEMDRLGIPLIDSRSIPDEKICCVIAFPMMPVKPERVDAAPWGGLSFAPIPVVAWLYQSLGAEVRNVTPRKPEAHELSDRLIEMLGRYGVTL